MKYKCLVLDHDDTAVKSTPELHYPSFLEIMETMRPGGRRYSLEEFMLKCFDPGFGEFCRGELGFDDGEMDQEYGIWKRYIQDKTPDFFEGFIDLVTDFRRQGGYVCVVSHSEEAEIRRHYAENGVTGLTQVYGWERPFEHRKPYAWPLQQIMSQLSLSPSDLIVLDDLKLGKDMADRCGVDFAAAGWGQVIPRIRDFMRENSRLYFSTVAEFREFLDME